MIFPEAHLPKKHTHTPCSSLSWYRSQYKTVINWFETVPDFYSDISYKVNQYAKTTLNHTLALKKHMINISSDLYQRINGNYPHIHDVGATQGWAVLRNLTSVRLSLLIFYLLWYCIARRPKIQPVLGSFATDLANLWIFFMMYYLAYFRSSTLKILRYLQFYCDKTTSR